MAVPRVDFRRPIVLMPRQKIISQHTRTLMRTSQQFTGDLEAPVFAELSSFVAIAEALSFTRAAERLRRDATVLSRRLRALEERLGVRLVERTTRSVMLTEAG